MKDFFCLLLCACVCVRMRVGACVRERERKGVPGVCEIVTLSFAKKLNKFKLLLTGMEHSLSDFNRLSYHIELLNSQVLENHVPWMFISRFFFESFLILHKLLSNMNEFEKDVSIDDNLA